MNSSLEDLVQQALHGSKKALEALIEQIQHKIYSLSLRMLWHPSDAEDATQEILVKIITHLDSFRGESSFTTWYFRIASNHLITTRKRFAERQSMSFEDYEVDIDKGMAKSWNHSIPEAESALLAEEVMIGCIQGMLLCLDRKLRITYILGEILEVNGPEGAQILGITPSAFRKRLSRARDMLRDFLTRNCGLFGGSSRCNCKAQIAHAVQSGSVDPDNLLFAKQSTQNCKNPQVLDRVRELDVLQGLSVVFRNHAESATPDSFVQNIRNLIDSGKFKLFQPGH